MSSCSTFSSSLIIASNNFTIDIHLIYFSSYLLACFHATELSEASKIIRRSYFVRIIQQTRFLIKFLSKICHIFLLLFSEFYVFALACFYVLEDMLVSSKLGVNYMMEHLFVLRMYEGHAD